MAPDQSIDRVNWLTQNDASDTQFGDLKDFNGGEIRRFRLGVLGTLIFEKSWVYTFFAATNAFDKRENCKQNANCDVCGIVLQSSATLQENSHEFHQHPFGSRVAATSHYYGQGFKQIHTEAN